MRPGRNLLTTLLVVLLWTASARAAAPTATRPPNIIFVLADDLGWAELGCYGNHFNQTPYLDRLARDGLRLTNAYAAAPVCSPYRAALLTGQYPARLGILDYLRPNSANALATSHVTLPEMLGRHGYSTGMIGKWHLTGYARHGAEHEITPRDHGFAWDIAREVKGVGNGANFWPYVFRKQPSRWIDLPKPALGPSEYLVDRMNHEAVRFIQDNRQRPFFLYLSHFATHSILNGRPDIVARYRKKHAPGPSTREKCYLCEDSGHAGDALNHWAGDHNPHLAAMLESIDTGVGMIRQALQKHGLAENTIIVFTSDNGGETKVTSNAPLRGGKSQLYEGGIRVPMIVCWPGHVPAGTESAQPTSNVDVYPTLLAAANIKPDPRQTLDGVSTLSTWTTPGTPTAQRPIFWHYPLDRPHFLGGRSSGAIRDGDWKLIEFFDSGNRELFHLADDPSEQKDLSAQDPARADKLAAKLVAWREQVSARRPSPPLITNPRQLYFADHFAAGHVSSRWHFTRNWWTENGVLLGQGPDKPTRVFLKKPEYRDVLIRFDFQFRQAEEIRLMTGGDGHYNAVVHLRPDHFFVQTALDRTGPWFPRRHGECAFRFQRDRWYTMTVEFQGDRLVAHIDHQHLAFAHHPILDKTRRYFAFQVSGPPAAFDNVQILTAARHKDQAAGLKMIARASGQHPVKKSLADEYDIRKRNAHELFHRTHPAYRKLIERLDELDEQNKQAYPGVFRSHKEFHKAIADERRRLHKDDQDYHAMLTATHKAARAIEMHLISKQPDVAQLPASRRSRAIETLRQRYRNSDDYRKLVAIASALQSKLETAYPRLFVTDKQISDSRRQRRKTLQKDPGFRRANDNRAAAWRAQQAYLFEHDKRLSQLKTQLDNAPKTGSRQP